jgi:hypothetical protein
MASGVGGVLGAGAAPPEIDEQALLKEVCVWEGVLGWDGLRGWAGRVRGERLARCANGAPEG